MLFGHIQTPDTYISLVHNEALIQALWWIRQMPSDQAPGIYEISGDEIFVNVHGYDTLPREQCRFESHRKYIDIQYCIEGGEFIDVQWASRLAPDGEFDVAHDLQFYLSPEEPGTRNDESGTKNQEQPKAASLHMTPGDFAIFFPEDAHQPKVRDGKNSFVRKLVVKIDRRLVDGD